MCPALAICQKVFTVHSGGESCIFGVCEQGFSHGKYLHSHQRSILRILGALLAKSASIWSLACNVIKAAVTLPSRSYQNDTRGERNWKLGSPGAHLSEIKKKVLCLQCTWYISMVATSMGTPIGTEVHRLVGHACCVEERLKCKAKRPLFCSWQWLHCFFNVSTCCSLVITFASLCEFWCVLRAVVLCLTSGNCHQVWLGPLKLVIGIVLGLILVCHR